MSAKVAKSEQADAVEERAELDMAVERFVTHSGGRVNWFREARRQLEEHRDRQRRPIPRDREDRLLEAVRRLEESHQVDLDANAAYEHYRLTGRDTTGRRFGKRPKPYVPPEVPQGKVNTSDLDSGVMRTQGTPPQQAYNAQTTVNDRQIILASEITVDAPDFGHLEPMFHATLRELANVGVQEQPEVMIADAGYWHAGQMGRITERGIEVLVPPDGTMREGKRPGWEDGLYQQMRDKLSTELGNQLYRRRKRTIEPVYGQIKHNRKIDRFMRRGRAAVQSEWRLVVATHNLLKLHSHWIAATT